MRLHALLIIVAALFPSTLVAREWTDVTGQYRRHAEFLGQQDGQVWLRDATGTTLVADIDRLSRGDQRYLVSLGQPDVVAPRQPAVDVELRVDNQPQKVVKTLAFRLPQVPSANDDAGRTPRLNQVLASASVMRLTGWHCYGGHCHVTPVHPVHPCPIPPDKGKRIYAGHYSTFHLVCRHPHPQVCGTGAYKFYDQQGCCHEYLVLLSYYSAPPNYLIYRVMENPVPLGIHYWLFENVPISKCCYNVYYWYNGYWYFYECSCRRIPE